MFIKNRVIFIITLFLVRVSCDNSDEDVVKWADFMVKAKWGTQELSRFLQPYLSETISHNNVSEQCAESLFRYINGLKEWDPWAVQMYDATGKIPTGFLSGTRMDFGSYDQCLEIKVSQNEALQSFTGQYCMLTMKSPLISSFKVKAPNNKSYIETYGVPPDWINDMMEEQGGLLSAFGLYLGICVPSVCSEEEIFNIITHVTKPTGLRLKLSDCQNDEPKKWPVLAVVSLYVLATLLAICVLGTIFDILDRNRDENSISIYKESTNRKYLKAFSFYTNTKSLFPTQSNHRPLDFLNGIRLLLTLWILNTHLYVFPNLWIENVYSNFNKLLKILAPITVVHMENGHLCVANFFHLSGFLMTYILWKRVEKSGGKLSIIQVMFHRYCRFTPTHLVIILISFVLPVIHKGPIWNSTWEHEIGNCQKVGWRNLFYIQNFLKLREMCWPHTWYIATCLQIQVVSLFLMNLTFRSPKKGVLLGLLLLAGCFMMDYTNSFQNNYAMPTLNALKSFETFYDMESKIYSKPFNYFGAHLIGMVLGWWVLKFKDHKLPLKYHVIGWMLYIAGSIFMLLSIRLPVTDLRAAAIYHASRSSIWALIFSWLVYCCTTGSGGIINRFLSWKALVPFSQISFGVYLIHPLLLISKFASLRNRLEITKIDILSQFPTFLLASFTFAYFIYISVEVPFNNLFDLFFKKYYSAAYIKEPSTKNGKEIVLQKNGKLMEKES